MKKIFASALIIAMLCGQAAFAANGDTGYVLPDSYVEDKTETETVPEVTESEEANKYVLPPKDNTPVEGIPECDEDTEGPSEITEKAEAPAENLPVKSELTVSISMIPKMKVVDSVAVFELYDNNGKLLATREEWIGGVTKDLLLKFEGLSVKPGDIFKLGLKSGLEYLKYYDTTYSTGGEVELVPYGYLDENSEAQVAADFAMDACPLYEQAIVTYISGVKLDLWPEGRLIDTTAVVPVRAVAEKLGLKVRYDEKYNSIVCEIGGKQAIFNVGTAYATILGNDIYMPVACQIIDGTAFVPVRTLAEAFGCSIEALDFGDHIDVCLGESSVVTEYRNSIPVNRWGLTSRTDYLVWIDKSDFTVKVYKGSKWQWEEIKSFKCAIGAPGSPTITGSFEYQYRMPSWNYAGYYVGPCLVFYGNYAMHSTLLRYDGSPYDNRVGVMISHGCVRLRKDDINWLDRNLPVKSRVYITE